ncbi:MAG: TMEM165/GDT1 family protein [Desulfobacterales bacterium]|nr:TMEM165/GDT1 family protein [Desulfobacterales bacterium]
MDIKVLFSTFALVFFAELGDKTQLATFCIAADCNSSRLSVFLGSALALILTSLLAVFCGDMVSRFIPETYIKGTAGIFFILAGVYILYSICK